MKVERIKNTTSFGIYKGTKIMSYGHKDIGIFKDKIITIHHDYKGNTKMFYVSDNLKNWIKSKLIYSQNGVKKIIWSKAK